MEIIINNTTENNKAKSLKNYSLFITGKCARSQAMSKTEEKRLLITGL